MLGYGMPQLIIILVIALIIFGPQKLPELARTLGKALADFKRAANDLKYAIEDEARNQQDPAEMQSREVPVDPQKEAAYGKDVAPGENGQAEDEQQVG
ncbi:MAG: twin-arginine translocase TatA/TatE family subunit [Geobacteraceae bacterium]|nr:twin-arginine translocase TatA/TatE family subunit [Geobacteraceae bacterium]